jgi:signal transduction histidine kinase
MEGEMTAERPSMTDPARKVHPAPSRRRAWLGVELDVALAEETRQLTRERLPFACGLFVLASATALTVDWFYLDKGGRALAVVTYDVLLFSFAVAAASSHRLARHVVPIAVTVVSALPLGTMLYTTTVGYPTEALVVSLVLFLEAFAVLLPWDWRAQAVVATVVVASGVACMWGEGGASPDTYLLFSLLFGGIVSTVTSHFLERHRRDALAHAVRLREEAEISATLVGVGRTLSAAVGRPDLFERIGSLIVDRMGADHCSIFFLDERRGAYRLAGNAGSSAEERSLLESIEFPLAELPVRNTFRPGRLEEIPGSPLSTRLPGDLLRRFRASCILCAPIARRNAVVGVIAIVFAEPRPRASEREKRLALGIADAVAVALENHRLVADLQHASELKSEFVSTVSHELRTPLNVIAGYCEMLADPAVGALGAEQADVLARVRRGVNELLELVNATLQLSRLDADRDPVQLSRISFPALNTQVAGELEPLVDRERVAVRSRCAGLEGTLVVTDRAKVATILRNLLSNAFKFTSSGAVDLEVRQERDELVIEVRDTGIGISAEHQAVIFDMFRQVDASPTRRFGGVGLGLHIVRRQAEALGGLVSVESALGRGSKFTVRLPARFVPAEADERAH